VSAGANPALPYPRNTVNVPPPDGDGVSGALRVSPTTNTTVISLLPCVGARPPTVVRILRRAPPRSPWTPANTDSCRPPLPAGRSFLLLLVPFCFSVLSGVLFRTRHAPRRSPQQHEGSPLMSAGYLLCVLVSLEFGSSGVGLGVVPPVRKSEGGRPWSKSTGRYWCCSFFWKSCPGWPAPERRRPQNPAA